MPRICEFLGISIYVYYEDHAPPHFHAFYSGDEVVIRIADLSIIRGSFPARALGLLMEWAALHSDDLAVVWARASRHEPLGRIDPLV